MTKHMDLSVQHKAGGGVSCPRCGAFGCAVQDSRPHTVPDILGAPINVVKRRRQCEPCGHRFNTLEIHAEIIERLDAAANDRRIPSRREVIWACIAQLKGML